jgi:MoxR-like ATPase
VRSEILELERQLQSNFVDRDEEIRGLLLGLLSKQHVLLLGPPGTAKTQIAHAWSKAFDLSYFRRLVTQFSTPEELFGPVDIAMLKQGIYRRIIEHKAADTELVLLDEVFKGGPTILNSLLSLMEERIFDNDGATVQAPLHSLIGTSNELPNDDEGLEAFYDRFLLRYMVGYLDDMSSFRTMIGLPQAIDELVAVNKEQLVEAQQEIEAMPVSNQVYDGMEILWEALREEDIRPSDRRFRQMVKVMAADSWLQGRSNVTADSLTIGQHILWMKPEQFTVVKRIVLNSVNPKLSKANEILEAAMEAVENVSGSSDSGELLQVLDQLKAMQMDLDRLGEDTAVVNIKTYVAEQARQLVDQMTGPSSTYSKT